MFYKLVIETDGNTQIPGAFWLRISLGELTKDIDDVIDDITPQIKACLGRGRKILIPEEKPVSSLWVAIKFPKMIRLPYSLLLHIGLVLGDLGFAGIVSWEEEMLSGDTNDPVVFLGG